MSKSVFGLPFTGRSETKKSVLPSGESTGSESRYTPENGAISGVVHVPFTKCDSQIT
jgi:hypothetical protein